MFNGKDNKIYIVSNCFVWLIVDGCLLIDIPYFWGYFIFYCFLQIMVFLWFILLNIECFLNRTS